MFQRDRRAAQPVPPAGHVLDANAGTNQPADAGTRDAAAEPPSHDGRPPQAETTLLRQIDSALELLVAGSLRQADEAAERGDFPEALAWLQTIDSMTLPAEYETKRDAWMRAVNIP